MTDLDAFYGIPQDRATHWTEIWIAVGFTIFVLFGLRFIWLRLRLRPSTSAHPPAETTRGSENYYETLGICRGASQAEIKRAYRERMREYHPDKVAGLGAELRELAERKAKEINRAFEALNTESNS